MSFSVGDILFFKEYQFSDTKGGNRSHFALALLPETATQYQGSVLCCVITSKKPNNWFLLLRKDKYRCFSKDSYTCFDRKDLVSKSGMGEGKQPKEKLNNNDKKRAWKILKKSLYCCNDLAANDPYIKATIIYEWKKVLKLIS